MTASRKEVQRLLRATFGQLAEQQAALSSSGAAPAAAASTSGGDGVGAGAEAAGSAQLLFEGYTPPTELLDAIDNYAGSSEVQLQLQSGQDRDIHKLQEVLLEDCYNEGILAANARDDASLQARARSAFIIVLAKFAGSDSPVVSPAEIRYVWWERILKPALLPQDVESFNYGSKHTRDRAELDHIRLGREAAKAAKEMIVKALCAAPDDKDNSKWRNDIFVLFFDAEAGSFGRRSLEEALVAFCKAHPILFFTTISAHLDQHPVDAVQLLNTSIRLAPLQAHQAVNTPLFRSLLQRLNGLSCTSDNVRDTRSSDVVHVSLALTALSMLLPRIPMQLDKMLDDLFLVLVHCLLWHKKAFSPRPRPDITQDPDKSIPADAFDYDDDEADPERLRQVHEPLPALLDYFTTLYGLFPANLLYFLTAPVQWLQSYARRQARRAQKSSSTGSRSLRLPDETRRVRAESSTSGGEEFPDLGDDEEQGFGEESDGDGLAGSSSLRRSVSRKSRPHGKGRRSKLKKQKKDASTASKKEREAAKQKERERRRRSANFLNAAQGEGGTGESTGMVQQLSSSSLSGVGDESEGNRVRIELPDITTATAQYEEASSSSSSEDEEEDAGDLIELDDALLRLDWSSVRLLSQRYITQHIVNERALCSPQAEFGRNKLRFKKLETSDIFDEIVRYRLPAFSAHSLASAATSVPPVFSPASTGGGEAAMNASVLLGGAGALSVDATDRVTLLETQLGFEMYQKQQLVQRLGAQLRETVKEGGLEADKQNLQHTIRTLKTQLKMAQDSIVQIRHESAMSRERLNQYSQDQAARVETLRQDRARWQTTERSYKSQIEEKELALSQTSTKLAESEQRGFELEAAVRTQAESWEKKVKAKEDELEKVKAELEELKTKQEGNQ